MESQMEKLRLLRCAYPTIDLAVDGGVTLQTAPICAYVCRDPSHTFAHIQGPQRSISSNSLRYL